MSDNIFNNPWFLNLTSAYNIENSCWFNGMKYSAKISDFYKELYILVSRPKLGRPSQWPWFRLLSQFIVIGSFALKECCGWEGNVG